MVQNPFNGIEREHISSGFSNGVSFRESIQWNWKTPDRELCHACSGRIHSMELKVELVDDPLGYYRGRRIHSMELKAAKVGQRASANVIASLLESIQWNWKRDSTVYAIKTYNAENPFNGIESLMKPSITAFKTSSAESIQWNWKLLALFVALPPHASPESIQWNWKD